ncbi:MAG: hypothetical protein COA86_04290 [Kangiella sp.]|nr:MAG: hypothetical protein COA86_04290 [Kangiella sp.]
MLKTKIRLSILKRVSISIFLMLGFLLTAQAKDVYVNNQKLDDSSVYTLEQFYKIIIADGYYWYDNLSGHWGFMGSPPQGQIVSGLGLGGPMPQNASNGKTGVIVNGRELHQIEVNQIIKAYGKVYRGRFWLNAQGLAGYEGQQAIFNFAQVKRKKSYNRRSLFGSTGGDGECFYYNHPGGSSVSNC